MRKDIVSFFDSIPSYNGAEYYYSQPIPELAVSGVSPFYGLHLAVWQLRDKDLQYSCPLQTDAGRKKFLAWCAVHGYREYRALKDLEVFWKYLSMPANIPKTEWSDGVSRFLYLAIAERVDLGIDPELHTVDQQRAALFWFISDGWRELELSYSDIPVWQKRYWIDTDDICESRFADFLYTQRPDLQKAFNLNSASGKQGFRHWLGLHAPEETLLELLREPNLLAWGQHCFKRSKQVSAKFGVNLIGYAFGELGIGEDVRMAAHALDAVGIPFTIIDFPPGDNIRQNDRSVGGWVTDRAIFSINVVCLTALEHLRLYAERGADLFEGRYSIGYWPWELESWPENWKHCFNLVDEVWASSQHIYQSIRAVTPLPVKYMPMAVALPHALDISAPKLRARFQLPENKYIFVFSFDGNSYIQRKNPAAVVAAFTQAFPVTDRNVGLVVKCMRPDLENPEWQKIIASAMKDDRIIIIDAMMSKLNVMELYRACDCFVSLHRAEGFGRGIAEALLLGLDVIATSHGGNVDFCREAGAYLVAYKSIALKKKDYVEAFGKYWAEPDIEDATRVMRDAHRKSYNRRLLKGSKNAEVLKTMFSVKSVGGRYRRRLEYLKKKKMGLASTTLTLRDEH